MDAEIIVMSANPSLLAGSDVSPVIHRAAGLELEEYTKGMGPISVGQAVLSPGFNLDCYQCRNHKRYNKSMKVRIRASQHFNASRVNKVE